MVLDREQLAERCVSTSFDKLSVDYEGKKVLFTHSFRDAQGSVLEEFKTELVFSELLPRPITAAEERALLSFGLCHSTYVYLVAAKHAPLLQVRAGYFSPDELAFFREALAGALAEYYYLADLDLADFRLECCCSETPLKQPAEIQAAAAAAAAAASAQAALPAAAPAAGQAAGAQSAAQAPAEQPPGISETQQPAGAAARRHDRDHDLGHARPRVLVPFGGGKDSTLLIELLGGMGADLGWIYFGEWVGSWQVYSKFARLAAASPAADVVLAEQNLPSLERLKELNLAPQLAFQDYTAYVSFYTFASAFVALQQGYDYICVGNEYSANAINTTHPKYNYPVNHQYEKSFAAERAFHAFLRRHVHPRLYYFSGLQHMTELEIARRFAALCASKYLHLIISCNWATDDDWCGGCEKCAFVFLLFAAFLPVPDIMAKVFGVTADCCRSGSGGGGGGGGGEEEGSSSSGPLVPGSRESLRGVYDMYDSERHVPVFESLMGLAGHKPFECVGTPEECLAAMYLAYERYGGGGDGQAAGGGPADCCGDGGPSAPAPASEAGATEAGGGREAQEPQQERRGDRKPLPLLLRRHLGLITGKGKEEWDKIRESMRRVAETGRPGVPTMYPDWYSLGGGSGSLGKGPGQKE